MARRTLSERLYGALFDKDPDAGDSADISSHVIGIILLASGSLGVLGTFLSPEQVILVFAALGLAGAAVAWTLKEA